MTSSLESKTVAFEGQLWTEYLPNNSTVSLPGPVLVLGVKHAEEVGWGLGLHHLVHQQHISHIQELLAYFISDLFI